MYTPLRAKSQEKGKDKKKKEPRAPPEPRAPDNFAEGQAFAHADFAAAASEAFFWPFRAMRSRSSGVRSVRKVLALSITRMLSPSESLASEARTASVSALFTQPPGRHEDQEVKDPPLQAANETTGQPALL